MTGVVNAEVVWTKKNKHDFIESFDFAGEHVPGGVIEFVRASVLSERNLKLVSCCENDCMVEDERGRQGVLRITCQ